MKTESTLHRVLKGLLVVVAWLCVQPGASAQAPADTVCASEGERCWFPGTADVAYGAGGKWITKTLKGGFNCGVNTFGSDPAIGVLKSCKIVSTKCADEGGRCEFKGARTVKYGANGVFAAKTFKDGIACGVAAFGQDPVPNVRKQCFLSTPDEKPVNRVTWLGSHNAIASVAYGIIIQNSQRDNITAQLDYGVRALEIDIVYDQPPGYAAGVYLCHCGEAPHSLSPIEGARFHLPPGFELPGWTHPTPYTRFGAALQEIDKWLSVNPDEIVIIMLENNSANAAQFDAEVGSTALRTGIYKKTGNGAWPKKSELVKKNQRIVMQVGQDDHHKLDAAQSKYAGDLDSNHRWGGNLTPPSGNSYSKYDPANDGNKLVPVGAFHTSTPNELVARSYNEYAFLNARKAEWIQKGIPFPSIFQVNQPHIGDPLRFVNDLNGADYLISAKKDAVGAATGDTWQIRFENDAAFNAGIDVTYFEDIAAGPTTVPVAKVVSTGAVDVFTPVRMINIPRNTSPGQPIIVSVRLYSTANFELWKGTIPADFTGSPVPCFKASGILTSPKGGRCE